MPTKTSVQNNFTKGLLTEFSGLNFPENACTATSNCIFNRQGNVTRRKGIDYENNFTLTQIDRTEKATSTYRWLNAGGDGETQLLVVQVGPTLYFYESSNATTGSPLSTTLLPTTVNLALYSVAGDAPPDAVECQFSDGNGYLFVFHPNLTPFYCVFSNGTVTANAISIGIRDFGGIVEPGIPDNLRPDALSISHSYNLRNQGWTEGTQWSTTSNTEQRYSFNTPITWTFYGVSGSLPLNLGDSVTVNSGEGELYNSNTAQLAPGTLSWFGIVSNYNPAAGSLTITITAGNNTISDANYLSLGYVYFISNGSTFNIFSGTGTAKISTWHADIGNYPSNADVWWQFKNTSDVFDPTDTIGNVTLNSGPAPKGFYILDAFNQDRSAVSGVAGINPVVTSKRPKTGTWFQGRVWYTGIDDSISQQDVITPPSNSIFYSWSESIYFSQIITNTSQLGKCYQTNDPTSEDLFDLLPTDGGVIQIQGCGSIYKLFPIQTGVLVFAANGIWYITGSSGLGFTANDYSITKISGVESISSTSYVNVQGLPIFWNEEDIYAVTPASSSQRNLEQQGLTVQPLTLMTIKAFYSNIPLSSKKFARGYYNPITNVLQWVYRSTENVDITSRYEFDSILNFNTLTQAFYPWTISIGPRIHDVIYVVGPGGSASPSPTFKYLTSSIDPTKGYSFTFSEELDNITWTDWNTTVPSNYISTFTTGYALHGDAIRKWQSEYVFVYSNNIPIIPTPVINIPIPISPPGPSSSPWNPADKSSVVSLSNRFHSNPGPENRFLLLADFRLFSWKSTRDNAYISRNAYTIISTGCTSLARFYARAFISCEA